VKNNPRTLRRHRKNGSLLFIELIIVILFFSLAAAGCVTLFAQAYRDSQRSRDLSEAVIMAQNTAEYWKATGEIRDFSFGGRDLFAETLTDGNAAHITVFRDTEIIYELTAVRRQT
jgi:Tfp pilus assembly protein PilV